MWINKKYRAPIVSEETAEDSVSIEDTDYWREMEANRGGNLLAGARQKAGITQAELARHLRVRQNMTSDYERGRRPQTTSMAKKLSEALHINERHLIRPSQDAEA